MDSKSLYLDYNATSPLSESVKSWLKSGDLLFANPASQHSLGKAARKLINESRSIIYKTFHQNESDTQLFFHSGATEAFLTFTYSFSEMARLKGKELLVCYSKIDHSAVTTLAERYWGPHVKFFELKVNHDLSYAHEENFRALKDKKDNDPELIILYHHLWVHNETGFVSPLSELTQFKTIPDLYLHVDAVQAPGKIPDWQKLTVGDIFSFSAHKFGALKGIGFSFMKKGIPFHPYMTGGGQQQGLRSGTENPQGVKSVALALGDLVKVDVEKNRHMKDKLLGILEDEFKDVGKVLKARNMNSNTIYFYLHKVTSDIAVALFDLNGLHISAGSACSSGTAKDSAVLVAANLKAQAKNGLRLSLGFATTDEELKAISEALKLISKKLKSVT